MKVRLCPKCSELVISVGAMTFDFETGDIESGGRTVYGQYIVLDDEPLALSGPALMSARKCGMKLYRRHGILCAGWWKGRGRDGSA